MRHWTLLLALIIVIGLGAHMLPEPAAPAVAQSSAPWTATALNDVDLGAIAVDPTDPNRVLASSGRFDLLPRIFRSSDGGATWVSTQVSSRILRIVIAPSTPSIIYVGDGDGTVRRSTDSGATWGPARVVVRRGVPIFGLAVHPTNPNIVIAATDGSAVGTTAGGIYRSADGGETWSSVSSGLQGDIGRDVLFVPGNPPTLLAAMGSVSGSQGGVFKSSDQGANWTPTGLTGRYIFEIALGAGSPPTLYALSGRGSLHVSRDLGASWVDRPGLSSPFVTPHPTRAGVIYMSHGPNNWPLAVSRDDGATWERDDSILPAPVWPPAAADLVLSSDGVTQYLATNRGVFKRLDVAALPNLSVSRVEVTQAVQTPSNVVPLAVNRLTMARVFVTLEGEQRELGGIVGRLYVRHNGVEVPGSPFPASNTSLFRARPTPNPSQLNDSLNFLLPVDAIRPGQMTFWAEVNHDRRVAERTYDDNRSQEVTLTAVSPQPVELVVVPINYQRNGRGPVYTIDPFADRYWARNLGNLYPTRVHIRYRSQPVDFKGDLSTGTGWQELLDKLARVRQLDLGWQPTNSPLVMPKYYGIIAENAVVGTGPFIAGMAYMPGLVGAGFSLRDDPDLTAHEIGHTLGLRHAPCDIPGSIVPDLIDPKFVPPSGSISLVGVDVFNRVTYPPSTKDIMSYCGPGWLSRYHYTRLLNTLASTSFSLSAAPARGPAALIRGEIDGASGTITAVEPLALSELAEGTGAGAYELRLLDAADAELARYAFDPEVTASEVPLSGPLPFAVALSEQQRLAAVELWGNGSLLDRVTLAAGAPTLTARLDPTAPADATTVRVTWEATLASGDAASVNIRYSPDNGASWITLASDSLAGELSIDTRLLPASADGLLELAAYDLGRITTRELRLGPIANKPPTVAIEAGGMSRIEPNSGLVLTAIVGDIEDGVLPDSALTWRDQHGAVLGQGPVLVEPTVSGRGVISRSLTARDSRGNETTATITLEVGASVYLPLVKR